MIWNNIETVKDMAEWCHEYYGDNVTCGDVRNACETIFFETHKEISEDDVMIELEIGE